MATNNPLTVLKQHRTARGLTQAEFGAKLGVPDVTVSRWETGERRIDVAFVPKVSAETGIPAEQLRPDLAELLRVAE